MFVAVEVRQGLETVRNDFHHITAHPQAGRQQFRLVGIVFHDQRAARMRRRLGRFVLPGKLRLLGRIEHGVDLAQFVEDLGDRRFGGILIARFQPALQDLQAQGGDVEAITNRVAKGLRQEGGGCSALGGGIAGSGRVRQFFPEDLDFRGRVDAEPHDFAGKPQDLDRDSQVGEDYFFILTAGQHKHWELLFSCALRPRANDKTESIGIHAAGR